MLMGLQYGSIISSGGASVSVDVVGSKLYVSTASTTLTYTGITVGSGAHRGLVVALMLDSLSVNAAGISATCNGTAMTLVANGDPGSNLTPFSQLWAIAPVASGAATIVFTLPNASKAFITAMSFTGVLQTGGTTSFANGISSSAVVTTTVTCPSTDYAVWAANSGTGSFSGALGTSFTGFPDITTGAIINAEVAYLPGVGTTTVGSSATVANIVAVDVVAG